MVLRIIYSQYWLKWPLTITPKTHPIHHPSHICPWLITTPQVFISPPAPSIFFTPYIKSLSSFLRHHLSVRCAMWKDECVQECVCEAHRVSIPPLRDQSRCQMPGAHKKEHHAFQLTFSSSVPTHIRLTYLLPTTPAHCTTGFFSHTSRGMSASQGCFMSFIMLLDRGLEFMNTAFLCCRKYRINQSDLRINDNLSFATEFSRQGLIYGAENLQATFLSDKILKRVKLFNHALLT